MSKDELRKFITQWNNRFPYDHWWREKHSIPFLSEEHRKANFLFQRMEFEEDIMMEELRNKPKDTYTPNIGDFFKNSTTRESDMMKSFVQEAQYELNNLPSDL